MSLICVAGLPSYDFDSQHLTAVLADVGHVVVNDLEIPTSGVALLLYFAPQSADLESADHWLNLVNMSSADVVVTDGYRSPLPGQSLVSAAAFARNVSADRIADEIERVKLLSASSIELPRVLRVPKGVAGARIATTKEDLAAHLRSLDVRAIGVSDEVVRAFAKDTIGSRLEFDLSRFFRRAKKPVDSSFVKLRLSLGADVLASTATSMSEVLDDSRTTELVVLQGAPGSGKSLQLQYYEVANALRSIRGGSDGSVPIGLYLSLGEHAIVRGDVAPFEWMAQRWNSRMLEMRMDSFETLVQAGALTLLLDGFNELAYTDIPSRRKWMLNWSACINQEVLEHFGNRVVVACRRRELTVSLEGAEVVATKVYLEPLTPPEIDAIARRYSPRAADDLARAIERDPDLIDLYQTPFSLTDYLAYAGDGVPKNQSEIFWKRLAAVFARERGVRNHTLLDQPWFGEGAVTRLIESRTLEEGRAAIRALPLLNALGELAKFLTQPTADAKAHRTGLEQEEAKAHLSAQLRIDPDLQGPAVLESCFDLELLVQQDNIVKFQHQSLQDFFAATAIDPVSVTAAVTITNLSFESALGDLAVVIEDLSEGDELQLLPVTGYEEIFGRACELRPTLVREAIAANPWLAAGQLVRAPANAETNRRLGQVAATLEQRLLEAIDVRERVASLRVLGGLQALSQADVHRLLPSVPIPAGTWRLGLGSQQASSVMHSRPANEETVEAFSIGRYPVTNDEYRVFVEDRGYSTRSYWTPEGWTWRSGSFPLAVMTARWRSRRDDAAARPERALSLLRTGRASIIEAAALIRFARMSDAEVARVAQRLVSAEISAPAFAHLPEYGSPAQPVVGVSFHEATAYCNWLAARTGTKVRLPSENEWEAAALYALGSTVKALDDLSVPTAWEAAWGNTSELYIGRPTPVGSFNVADDQSVPREMSGNAFEWVTDLVTPDEDWRRVVKGGSFLHLMHRAHPAYRGRGDTTTRNVDNSFRIVMDI